MGADVGYWWVEYVFGFKFVKIVILVICSFTSLLVAITLLFLDCCFISGWVYRLGAFVLLCVLGVWIA